MAGLSRPGSVRYGKSFAWDADLDHNVHDDHITHSPVRSVLYEPNIHHECYYTVCTTHLKELDPS